MRSISAARLAHDGRNPAAALWGAIVGTLAGLIGLGGAEFRLPILIGLFRFVALEAVILNKAMSLIVVAAALPFRMQAVPLNDVLSHWQVILNLLTGSLIGAWLGASWATQLSAKSLYRIIATLLVVIAVVLVLHTDGDAQPLFMGATQVAAGLGAGLVIGVVASLLGVAGGELLIPTLVILFGVDIKLAGSLSLAVSLPTMVTGFVRYSRDQSFVVIRNNGRFMFFMAAGSIVGAYVGSLLLGVVPGAVLLPLLAVILLFSAIKIWRHH